MYTPGKLQQVVFKRNKVIPTFRTLKTKISLQWRFSFSLTENTV